MTYWNGFNKYMFNLCVCIDEYVSLQRDIISLSPFWSCVAEIQEDHINCYIMRCTEQQNNNIEYPVGIAGSTIWVKV